MKLIEDNRGLISGIIKHYPALRSGNHAEDDLAQDVSLEIFRHIERNGFPRDQNLPGWVAALTKHTMFGILDKDHAQKRTRHSTLHDELQLHNAATPTTPSDLAARRETIHQLLRVISRLNPKYQHIIHARVFENQPFLHIANRLGISEQAALSRYKKALALLRKSISRSERSDIFIRFKSKVRKMPRRTPKLKK